MMDEAESPDKASEISATAERRFVHVESHVTELERLLEQLNTVVMEQGKAIRRLIQHQRETADTLGSLEMDRIRSAPTKPPHSVL